VEAQSSSMINILARNYLKTNERHDCPARRDQQQQKASQSMLPEELTERQQQQRRHHQCNKGCGQEIYFDSNSKSQSGKFELKDKIKYNYHYAYDVISVFIPFS
jgi:hypothetical protein